MNREGVIPTLFLNNQVINTDSDIAAYILKFLFWNPGRTSNQIEDELVSMRYLAAKYGENINSFPQALQDRLTQVLKKYNDKWTAEVTVINRSDDKLTYGLNIRMTDGAGNLLINTNSLAIKDGMLTVRNEMDDDDSYDARSRRTSTDGSIYNILTTAGILTINKSIRTVEQLVEDNKRTIYYSSEDAPDAIDDLKFIIRNKSFTIALSHIEYLLGRLTAFGNLEVHEKLTDEEIEATVQVLTTVKEKIQYMTELQRLVDNNDTEKLSKIFPNALVNGDLSAYLE